MQCMQDHKDSPCLIPLTNSTALCTSSAYVIERFLSPFPSPCRLAMHGALHRAADALLCFKFQVIPRNLEKVAMTAPLPMISSSLIQRLDVNRDDERILLTLTATQPSRFSFRVQQSPTTLILGVLPDQRFIARQEPVKSVETVVETRKQVTPVASTESDLESTTPVKASSFEVDPQSETPVDKPEPKPVTKAKRELSDKQVVARARKLLNQTELEAAEQLLRNRITKHPQSSVEARGLLATLMLSTGNLSQAKELISSKPFTFCIVLSRSIEVVGIWYCKLTN